MWPWHKIITSIIYSTIANSTFNIKLEIYSVKFVIVWVSSLATLLKGVTPEVGQLKTIQYRYIEF